MSNEELLLEFIEWAKNCGEDVFYIFDETDEAIQKFLFHNETYGGSK